MDIQSSTATSNQPINSAGAAGATESAASERKEAVDSANERKEAEPSSTGPGVGDKVDIKA